MTALIAIVATLLLLFQWLLLARAALSWSVVLIGPSAPGSIRDRLSAGLMRLTEPVLAPVRRVLPPLRLGSIALDTAFIAVLLGVSALRQVILGLGG
jgi:YggT family protein